MDKMREEFEAWASSEGLPLLFLDKHNFYESHVTDIAWQAWQASRQALVVEPPPQHSAAYRAYDGVELRYALKEAGIKWTE